MDSQEDSSDAIAPSLMADLLSLDIPYNYFAPPQFELPPEGWKAGLIGPPLGASSPALVAPDPVAVESAPVPKKRRLSLSLSRVRRLSPLCVRSASGRQSFTLAYYHSTVTSTTVH